jgi:2-polyprenyl-3-methyl-5-hydroxy-6-metoxy-1,4-benzoquinol methylase
MDDPMSHWYYKHKFREILRSIRRYKGNFGCLSDVGSGSAVFSQELSKLYKKSNFNLIDINYSSEQIAKSTAQMKYTKDIEPADVFLLTDVLEHIENASDFFKQICDFGKENDLIIITVPAFMQLWSGHDVFLKHFRRYTKKSLINELKEMPIEILEVKYLYQALFLPAYLYRKMFGRKSSSQLKKNNRTVAFLLDLLLRFESDAHSKMPFGISILFVARIKKD